MAIALPPPATGQFDDAEDALGAAPTFDPREGSTFIDEQELLAWSEDDDEEDLESTGNEDALDEDMLLEVDDEDWEIAERGVLYET